MALQDGLDVVDMFLLGPGKDEDVVQVDKNVAVQHVPKHVIHQGLEHSRGVRKTEGHHQVPVVTSSGIGGGFHSSPSRGIMIGG